MRQRFVLLRVLCAAVIAGAWSAPRALTAQTPAGFWISGVASSGDRAASFGSTTASRAGTITGVELWWRREWWSVSMLALGAEFAGATASSGTVATGEVRATLGRRALGVDVGVARRALAGAFGTVTTDAGRVGLRTELPLGGTGFSVGAALGTLVGASDANGDDAESWIRYASSSR
ncbi:MAG: hypothetical protein SFW08_11275, partial [Gemmatimonadaceae bacterium]|nr:hypothetical protein [Gemmatimonadaceae bacterium]